MPSVGSYSIRGDSKLHYLKIGVGPKSLLVFHGFGMDLSSKSEFQTCFPEHTIYFFDLFYHGQSIWPNSKNALTVKDFNALMKGFFQNEKIARFDMLGFSIGAKSALALLQNHASLVDQLILIAPDGIVYKYWYWLATGSKVGQLLFKKVLQSPSSIYTGMDWLARVNLIPNKLKVFVRFQLASSQKRDKIYKTWMVYRKLKLSVNQLLELLSKQDIRVSIFAGSKDTMFPPADFEKFVSLLPAARLVVLESDHTRLVDEVLKYYTQNGYIA